MHVHVELKKVLRIGKSLSFILPSVISRSLSVNPSTRFYVFMDGDSIVYSLEPPEGTIYAVVKARLQSRTRGHEYYVLTIPHTYAKVLGINVGDKVVVELDETGKRVILRKYR